MANNDKLRAAREKLKLSLRDAAELLGVSHETIRNYERGRYANKPQTYWGLGVLCAAYAGIAAERGLDVSEFQPHLLLPDMFPKPNAERDGLYITTEDYIHVPYTSPIGES